MEYEMLDRPRREEHAGDARIIRDTAGFAEWLVVDVEDYPEEQDKALLIPEEEDI